MPIMASKNWRGYWKKASMKKLKNILKISHDMAKNMPRVGRGDLAIKREKEQPYDVVSRCPFHGH